jgi:drug/metabolite transporter (DMT)-like permease
MRGETLVAVPLALGAAGCFGVANVLQTVSVRRTAPPRGVELGLVARLARDPLWLAGLSASIGGFGLEAVALGLAPVVLVQPLIVAELLFALPLGALAAGSRLGRREWSGAVAVAAGLGLFMLVVRPSNPRFTTSGDTWTTLACVAAATVAVLVGVAVRVRGLARTSAMAAAAAVALGLLAVLTKTAAHDFAAHGMSAVLTWQPWAVAAAGVVGLSLAQNTFGAGPLAVSLPLIDVGEPLVASIISVVVFGERLGHLTVASAGLLVSAGLVVTAGVVLLDRSPLVQAAQQQIATAGTATPDGFAEGVRVR